MAIDDIDNAAALAKTNPEAAIAAYRGIIAAANDENISEETAKIAEQAIQQLSELFKAHGRAHDLAGVLFSARSVLRVLPKAKTAKLVRTVIDLLSGIPNALPIQIELCKTAIEWATAENRIFLKQSLETRLISLYLENKMYQESLVLINTLLRELKRLDDKMLLVEVQLLESRVFLALRNLPKSRAALTSARTSANSIYCPPVLQTALDMQSGVLHAEEKDYKTAYSYFYETLEGYSAMEDPKAVLALKYLLLCKIMLNNAEDVHAIIHGKLALKYAGAQVEAMKAVANAYQHRSLQEFEQALHTFKEELTDDPLIKSHLQALYDTLLEQNLTRIIEPFSRVEIAHVAELISLPVKTVENKLSQMILDKVLSGILDQGAGCLVLFDTVIPDKTYTAALDTIKNLSNVVESLYLKANNLS